MHNKEFIFNKDGVYYLEEILAMDESEIPKHLCSFCKIGESLNNPIRYCYYEVLRPEGHEGQLWICITCRDRVEAKYKRKYLISKAA